MTGYLCRQFKVEVTGAVTNRIGRAEYLSLNLAALFGFLLLIVVTLLLSHQKLTTHLVIAVGLVVYAYFRLAVLIPKRLHDMNESGWWTLIFLLPLIGFAFQFILAFKPGTSDANKYGSIPRTWPWEKVREP